MSHWKKPLLIVAAILALAAFVAPSAASASESWTMNEVPLGGVEEAEIVTGAGSGSYPTDGLWIHDAVILNIYCEVPSLAGKVWNEESTAAGRLSEFQTSECWVMSWGEGPCGATAVTNIETDEEGWPLASLGNSEIEIGNIEIDIYGEGGPCKNWSGPISYQGTLTGKWNNSTQELEIVNATGLKSSSGKPTTVNGTYSLGFASWPNNALGLY